MNILAIDPGNIESAYVFIDEDTYKPILFNKSDNSEVLRVVSKGDYSELVIEMVASYGMPVGATVFDTCVMIGRFMQIATIVGKRVTLIYRREVKLNLCHTMKAKDSNITQALIDRFAKTTQNKGKGSKKKPGFFYGFKADIWQAYALGVTHIDKEKKNV